MKNTLSFLCLLLLPSPAGASRAATLPCPTRLLGTWEYRQAAGDGFDAEGERLELTCGSGSLRGLYFGLEREGEEGLFYTLVEVRNLTVSPSGNISFLVPERELYQKRPRNPDDVKPNGLPSSGISRDELHYGGRWENDKLVLTCTAKLGTCPDSKMVFQRGG